MQECYTDVSGDRPLLSPDEQDATRVYFSFERNTCLLHKPPAAEFDIHRDRLSRDHSEGKTNCKGKPAVRQMKSWLISELLATGILIKFRASSFLLPSSSSSMHMLTLASLT